MPINPPNPLANVPDPNKRYQVFGVVRDGAITIEIADASTLSGFILDPFEALQLAADINQQMVHVLGQVADTLGIPDDPEQIDPHDRRWTEKLWSREE